MEILKLFFRLYFHVNLSVVCRFPLILVISFLLLLFQELGGVSSLRKRLLIS